MNFIEKNINWLSKLKKIGSLVGFNDLIAAENIDDNTYDLVLFKNAANFVCEEQSRIFIGNFPKIIPLHMIVDILACQGQTTMYDKQLKKLQRELKKEG